MAKTREICWQCEYSPGGCNGACRPAPQSFFSLTAKQPPKGCICPPAANLTCQRPDCGRRPVSTASLVDTGAKAFEEGMGAGEQNVAYRKD